MSISSGRAWEDAPGKRPISQRLEHVRAHFGFETLREFYRELTETEGFGFSYEALRNYHYDRDPPVPYLGAVSRRFGVSLDFLVFGDGPMLPEVEQERSSAGIDEMLAREFRGYDDLPEWSREVVRAAVRRIAEDQLLTRSAELSPDEAAIERDIEEGEAAFYVAAALSEPLERPGTEWSGLWPTNRALYAAGIANALMALLPTPTERFMLDRKRESEIQEKADREAQWRRENPEKVAEQRERERAQRRKRENGS